MVYSRFRVGFGIVFCRFGVGLLKVVKAGLRFLSDPNRVGFDFFRVLPEACTNLIQPRTSGREGGKI